MPEIEYVVENALFGKYELGKLLGCGAFAKVYHARNVQTGQSVAIKVISKKKIFGTNLMNNIKREVSIMRRLNHPNIVKLFEVLATRNKIYFVLEYVKGGELFAKVAKARFTEDLARKYFQQLISAVAFCHVRGIFHRDLKPENLLVDENGDLKVSDFGLSALPEQIRSDGLLHTLCGTPAYVAPEILSKKGYDGAKVDVWSCGVVLFVLIAGYLPFNDPNLMAMYKKIYNGEYRCPKWMSPDLKRFLSRLLDINPTTRITVDEILRDSWFRKGGFKGIKLYEDDLWGKFDKDQAKVTHLNAFDIISFSSGLNLSGLFESEKQNVVDDGGRIVSVGSPEEIVEKVEEFAKAEKLKVMRKREWGVEIGGQNGQLAFGVEVFRLTEDTVVVESRRRGGNAVLFNEFWKNKLRPMLINESEVAQSSSASTSESSASTSASSAQPSSSASTSSSSAQPSSSASTSASSAQPSSSASTSGSGNYTTITTPIVSTTPIMV